MPRRVYIHVGLPKTGTSYLQQSLWLSREALSHAGVLVPGDTHRFQRFAFWDLLGRRLDGANHPGVPGAWTSLVETVRGWQGDRVVLSDEFLANARPRHVRRIVRAFGPAEVHVVVTVRDLHRMICSMWQQELSKGRTWTWPEYVAAVRDPEQGSTTAGVAFWLRCDLRKVLATWEAAVPAERIHVVCAPPEGSAPTRLLELFASATGLDPARLTPAEDRVNTSVGAAQAELLRRVNLSLEGRLNERQYLYVMRQALKPTLRRQASGHVSIPPADQAWLGARSAELVTQLRTRPYDVVGEAADLCGGAAAEAGDMTGELDDERIAGAAVEALTATLEQYATYWWDNRRRVRSKGAAVATRAGSAGRARSYRARARALDLADRNRVLGLAARLYLRRTSRGG